MRVVSPRLHLTGRSSPCLGETIRILSLGDQSFLNTSQGAPGEMARVPLSTFEDLIMAGRLLDTHVIAALSMTKSFLERHPL
jgi:hypothetical protein